MRKAGLFYPLLLLVCWTGIVGAGTYALAQTTVRQHLARKFSTAPGKMIRSEVGHGAMTRRGLEIEYNYTVDDIEYTGHRYRYDDHNAAFEWDATVEERPRWSSQTVYYDPENPADSLLQPGIDGGDLELLLFALPLNVLTVIFWRGIFGRWRELSNSQPAGGVRIVRKPGKTRVLLRDISTVSAGFYGAAAAAFIGVFPLVILEGFNPSLAAMKLVWAGVLLTGVVALAWGAFKNGLGTYDLCIDEATKIVRLPKSGGRPAPVSIALGDISGIALQRRISTSPSGNHVSYLPALTRAGENETSPPMKLTNWGWSEKKAEAFSQWLGKELGLEFKGIQEEPLDLAAKN